MNLSMSKLILIIVLSLTSIYVISCSTCIKHYEGHQSIEVNGMIIKKFRNENHAIRTFELQKEGKQFSYAIFYDIPGLWDHSEVGDSLIKPAGSLEYKLVKPDTVLYFYPECVSLQSVGIIENPKYRSK